MSVRAFFAPSGVAGVDAHPDAQTRFEGAVVGCVGVLGTRSSCVACITSNCSGLDTFPPLMYSYIHKDEGKEPEMTATATATTAQNITAIEAAGNRWIKGNMDRIYINPVAIVDIIGGYTTGGQAHITDVDGPEYGTHAIRRTTKVFYDLTTGEWVVQERTAQARCVEEALTAHFAQTETAETVETEAVETEPATVTRRVTWGPSKGQTITVKRTPAGGRCRECGGYISADDAAMAVIPGIHFDCA